MHKYKRPSLDHRCLILRAGCTNKVRASIVEAKGKLAAGQLDTQTHASILKYRKRTFLNESGLLRLCALAWLDGFVMLL